MVNKNAYISHMVGDVSEDEYEALDKDFSEAMEAFGRLRQRPAIIFIEKWFAERPLMGESIYNALKDYGFSKGISQKVMSKLIANEISVIPDLQYIGYNIKDIEYNTDYKRRLEILGLKEVIPQYPREVEIKIRPMQMNPEECTYFQYLDQLVGTKKSGEIETYRLPNQIDKFTKYIRDEENDNGLDRVHPKINKILDNYFATLHIKKPHEKSINEPEFIIPSDHSSRGSVPESECSESRTYELQIYPLEARIGEVEAAIYGLIYRKGKIVASFGFPAIVDKIVDVLKKEGKWEV